MIRHIRRIIVILFAAVLAIYLVTCVGVSMKKDTTAPVITCDVDEIEVASAASEEELLEGLKATDDTDGDITDRIRIGGHSKFITKGVCEVSYLVFDSSYNAGQYTRRVVYTDYVSPKFVMTDSLVYDISPSITMLDRIQARDAIDGDISEKIRIVSSNINEEEAGTYKIGIEVTNDYGDISSLELPVHIIAGVDSAPDIRLTTYLVYVKQGEVFDPYRYIEEVKTSDGAVIDRNSVTVNSKVNTSAAGTYEVRYSCKDNSGRTGYSYLIAVVTE